MIDPLFKITHSNRPLDVEKLDKFLKTLNPKALILNGFREPYLYHVGQPKGMYYLGLVPSPASIGKMRKLIAALVEDGELQDWDYDIKPRAMYSDLEVRLANKKNLGIPLTCHWMKLVELEVENWQRLEKFADKGLTVI